MRELWARDFWERVKLIALSQKIVKPTLLGCISFSLCFLLILFKSSNSVKFTGLGNVEKCSAMHTHDFQPDCEHAILVTVMHTSPPLRWVTHSADMGVLMYDIDELQHDCNGLHIHEEQCITQRRCHLCRSESNIPIQSFWDHIVQLHIGKVTQF